MKTAAGAQKSEQSAAAPAGPARAVPPVQRLQRVVGNYGLQRFVQMKPRAGATGDPLEREADRVADRVAGTESCGGCSSGAPCASCGGQAATQSPEGAALDPATRVAMQQQFGADFGDVRLHMGDSDAARAHALGARAFTLGHDIVFGRGEYQPDTGEGRHLLAHELAHVVQQRGSARGVQRAPDDNQSFLEEEPNECVAEPEEEQVCVPPDPKAPPEPGPNVLEFDGWTLSTDPVFVRYQLEQYIAEHGEEGAGRFRRRFLLFAAYGAPAYHRDDPLPAGEWDLRKKIYVVIDTQLSAIHSDNSTFLGEFQQRALYTVRQILHASEERVRAAAEEYGISAEQVMVATDTGRDHGQSLRYEKGTKRHMADNASTRDLAAATGELVAKLAGIASLRAEQRKYVKSVESKGRDPISYDRITDYAGHSAVGEKIAAAEREYASLRKEKERDHPMLTAVTDNRQLQNMATGPSDPAAEAVGGIIAERLANIDKMWEGLSDGDVKIWKLPSIVEITSAQMGVDPASMHARAIKDKIQDVADDEFWTNLGIGVLALGLGLLAAIPSGGSSLWAAGSTIAAVSGAALSGYMAYEHYQEYELAAAAGGTDFDRARAISQEDPSLFWLALDIAGAVLDLGAALSAFRSLGPAARAAAELKAGADVADDATLLALREQGNAIHPGLGDKLAHDAVYARQLNASRTASVLDEVPDGVLAARAIGDGHELKAVTRGKAIICSWPCEFLSSRYRYELEANPGWKARLDQLESEMAAAEAAGRQADIDKAFDDIASLEVQMRVDHRRRLGFDLDNKQYRAHESDAAEGIENHIGAPLTRLDSAVHPTKAGDWIDPWGRTWDAVGPVPQNYFNLWSFNAQIDGHMLKQGLEFVWVDLRGLTAAQRRDVLAHINSLPRRAKPLIRIGT